MHECIKYKLNLTMLIAPYFLKTFFQKPLEKQVKPFKRWNLKRYFKSLVFLTFFILVNCMESI